ncbi:hypothetical protein [Bacillus sp. JCM 19034]|uniref:hypothetical protein n=1 Tax=Bacillus sp. JCM 19034 TaxID=1481928 RepID=UPI000783C5FE|nr:hypothetical protein [Bacillus sp. JCM 19034]
MIQEKLTKEQLMNLLKEVEEGKRDWREADLWEWLNIAETYEDFPTQLLSKLYIWLAKSRFKRTGYVDAITSEWLKAAEQSEAISAEVTDIYVDQLYSMMRHLPLPRRFQPIRETDNSVTKKETAGTYFKAITEFQQQFTKMKDVWERIKDRVLEQQTNQEQMNIVAGMEKLYELEDMFQKLERRTKRYLDSLQGIYHSVQLYGELLNLLKQIEAFSKKWHALLNPITKNIKRMRFMSLKKWSA